jgi:hypothetical protein
MTSIHKNDSVTWKWGKGKAEGNVTARSSHATSLRSRGKKITRKGSQDNPALRIVQSDGTKVLKKASEVTKK